jgi:CheY-like chemotaxis protein
LRLLVPVHSPRFAQRRRTDGARILLIEDDQALRRMLETTLQHDGYVVDAVATAEAAMKLLETHAYVLVLSDYNLPGKSGVWLLSEAGHRGLLRGAATRLVTAQPDATDITLSLEVFAKPIDFEEFLPQIRAIVASAMTPLAAGDQGTPRPGRALLIELVLYVSPESLPCARALGMMRRLLGAYDRRRIRFAVCDVAADPVQAESDHIIFTPSLVRRSPRPRTWIIGDLAQPRVVDDFLQASGARLRAAGRSRS